jgi:hypothetical protein
MMDSDTVTVQEFQSARRHLIHYFRHTERRGVPFFVADLPPFINVNGSVSGPFYELMESVAADLGTKPQPIRGDWKNFAEDLARGTFKTVAAPIMPVHIRAFQIVNLVELRCGALFYALSLGPRAINDIKSHTHQCFLASQPVREDDERRDLSEQAKRLESELGALARLGRGFAAGKVFFEQYLLQRMNAPIALEMDGRSLVAEAIAAARENHLCVIDFTTLRQIEDVLGSDAYAGEFEHVPLLGNPISIPAGLPFVDEEFGKYLWYRWRHDVSDPFGKALSKLAQPQNGHYTEQGFQLVNREILPLNMEPPGVLTTRNLSFVDHVAGLVHSRITEGETGAVPGLFDNAGLVPTAVSKPRIPGPFQELESLLIRLEARTGSGSIQAVRQLVQENLAASDYVARRYRNLVNQKYLHGLSASEERDIEDLKATLDAMDAPYYTALIEKLRKLLRARID